MLHYSLLPNICFHSNNFQNPNSIFIPCNIYDVWGQLLIKVADLQNILKIISYKNF